MKQRDKDGMREIIHAAVERGLSLTEAIERAYAWLQKSARKVWPHDPKGDTKP